MGLIVSHVDVGYITKTIVSNDVLFLVLCKIDETMAVINSQSVKHVATFQAINIAVISLTSQESDLRDALQYVIVAAQQSSMFSFQDVTGLVFDEAVEPYDAQFVEESGSSLGLCNLL
ncbi:hypothetical protein Trydic_g13764 [Trypoxylus dichotomus]